MLKRLQPCFQIKKLVDLDPSFLLEQGIKGVMMDLDNTLVAWGEDYVSPEMIAWVYQMKKAGLKLCIISNALENRVKIIGEILEMPWVSRAIKPRKSSYKKALKILGTKPDETAVVGDQLFTDIWGGNRMALFTIWTRPLSTREFLSTKLVRQLERLIIKRFQKKGIISE